MRTISKLLPASKLKLVMSSIGVIALAVFSIFVIYETTKVEVVFADNGEDQHVKTHADTVKDFLQEIGITVGKHDFLSHEMDAEIKAGMKINYDTAKKVVVII